MLAKMDKTERSIPWAKSEDGHEAKEVTPDGFDGDGA